MSIRRERKINPPMMLAVMLANSTAPAAMSRHGQARRLALLVESAEQRLQGAVEQIGGEHQADAAQQKAPLEEVAVQHDGGGQNEGGEEEMDRRSCE